MYLGIDPSLTNTGLVIINGDGKVISSHSIKGKGKEHYFNRVTKMIDVVEKIIKGKNIVCAGIENYSYGSVGKWAQLVTVGALMRDVVHRNGILIYEAPPSVLKQFATQRGNATKPMMEYAAKKIGVELKNNDEIDAFWLAKLALYKHSGGESPPLSIITPK